VNRRRLIQRTLATPTLAVLVACGPSQTADPKPAGTTSASGASGSATSAPSAQTTQSQTTKPVKGGTLNVVMSRDATNFDPIRQNDAFSSTVLNTVVDTLYEIDSKGSVVGRLVEKTENPSANVYVMTLRKGIMFQDGTPLNAEAVKFNLERAIHRTRMWQTSRRRRGSPWTRWPGLATACS